MQQTLTRQFGVVKWFGGFNKTTQKENDFGFVVTASGFEYFLHISEWSGIQPPVALHPVAFEVDERSRRPRARRATGVEHATVSELVDGILSLSAQPLADAHLRRAVNQLSIAMRAHLGRQIADGIGDTSSSVKALCSSDRAEALFQMVAEGPEAASNYRKLLAVSGVDVTADVAWGSLPRPLLAEYEPQIGAHFATLDAQMLHSKTSHLLADLPSPLIVLLLLKGAFTSKEQLGPAAANVAGYLRSLLCDQGVSLPEFLQAEGGQPVRLAPSA